MANAFHICVIKLAKYEELRPAAYGVLGFNIIKASLKPTSEIFKNITSFPTPRSLSDVRSWQQV